jgi:hypothetical protein
MKKVMFALCFMFGGIVAVSAQETQDTTSNQYRTETQSQSPQDAQGQNQDQDRERIQSTELPDVVKRSLEGQEYRGWLINGAYKAKATSDQPSADDPSTDVNRQDENNAIGAQGEEIYIVELKNGAQTKTVRFDSEGNEIEGMEGEDQEDQNNQYNQNDQRDQNQQQNPNDQSNPNQDDQTIPNQNDETSPNNQDDQVNPNDPE